MKPKILFSRPSNNIVFNTAGGCDADCACSIPVVEKDNHLKIQDLYTSDCANYNGCNNDGGYVQAQRFLDGKILRQSSGQQHFVSIDDQHSARLIANATTHLFVLNTPAQEIFDFFAQPHNPTEWSPTSSIDYPDAQTAISQLYEAGLLQDATVQPSITHLNHASTHLEAWLYITRSCNLFCAHCFVDKDMRCMSVETGLQTVERVFDLAKNNGHPEIKLKYAGGEPTMNWEVIPILHERAKFRAQETGLKLTEVLVTNATLLNRKRLQFIKDENFRLAISLDGFGEGHDLQRPTRNGHPTFERVFQSILLALRMGISPYLIITVTRLNVADVPALVSFALEHRLMLNLNFYRPHHPNDTLVVDDTTLTKTLKDALKVIEANLPNYNFMEGLIDRSNFGVAHQYACGAGRNYISIDTDGSVLPCHMLTGYNLPGVPFQMLESPHFDDFPNLPIDHRDNCNSCEWRHWCAGGCSIHTKNIMGASNVSSPYCNVYKVVYPDLVRLQALQLLRADALIA
jgi:uncharacterized protein